jgi:4-diphosphocytidyl-2-C-methyl-D-erythritol kinase
VPAKINLHLSVGRTRSDGFHELSTVFQALSLCDEVTVAATDKPGVEIHGEGAGELSDGEDNLAWRAVVALAQRLGRSDKQVRVVLRKRIPLAGGMAGGSADAAATLVGLAALWKAEIGRDELAEIAAELGSDVPFPLYGGTALGTGRGEQLVPVLSRHTFHWVLAFDHEGLSTPTVFQELDRLRANGKPLRLGSHTPVIEALASGDPRQLALLLGNDLQAAAVSLRPDLRRTLRAGVDSGALAGMISGSGPTCAFLCEDGQSAIEVAARLSGVGVCRTVRVASGPVPGARIVEEEDTPRATPPKVHA